MFFTTHRIETLCAVVGGCLPAICVACGKVCSALGTGAVGSFYLAHARSVRRHVKSVFNNPQGALL